MASPARPASRRAAKLSRLEPQRHARLVFAVEQAHHHQAVVAVRAFAEDAHALAQPTFLDEAFAGVERQRPRVERLHVEPEAVRAQVAEGHALEQPHAGAAQALALGLQYQALEFDTLVRVAAALQDDEAVAAAAGAGLDDEVAEVGETQRAFVLRALPRRDERAVGGVGLHRLHVVEVGQHRRPQMQRRQRWMR
ncbi:MAG: hypothetical protein IPF94_18645 [Betaproteobacteria bacterium]|nr:hypothetical protein [Betaproteobacteria bacterium]